MGDVKRPRPRPPSLRVQEQLRGWGWLSPKVKGLPGVLLGSDDPLKGHCAKARGECSTPVPQGVFWDRLWRKAAFLNAYSVPKECQVGRSQVLVSKWQS